MAAPSNQAVIHVGRPDECAPHRSMEKVFKFRAENPLNKFIAVVWEEKDYEAMKSLLPEGTECWLWQDNKQLMNTLMDRLNDFAGAQVVGPRWYVCDKGHETPATYDKLVEKCSTCQEPCKFEEPLREKLADFCKVFERVIRLTNFDTRSGEQLTKLVNPIRNVCLNMRYALGCEHEAALDVRGKGKGKPALLCAAGPSLEDALPDIKRLEEKCVIACVGRSYKLLRRHDIRVDYTLSVEMFPWDGVIFEGLATKDVGETVLAYAPVCSHETVKNWPGRRTCMWDPESAQILGQPHWILGGNSVAHHMLNFAIQTLECDPIVLVGVDLAYPKPRTHAEGTFHNWPEDVVKYEHEYQQELWVPCTGKGGSFNPECHRADVAFPGGKPLQMEVRSSYAYRHFADLFSILAAKHEKPIWNACPNGQRIEGIPYLDLSSWAP